MAEDIEDLKQNKIAAGDGRTRLTVDGQPKPGSDSGEAYGGSGEQPVEAVEPEALRERIIATLREIYDPEIPVNIYDLGLVYGVEIDDVSNVEIQMTLTAPACPVAGMIVEEVATRVGGTPGVRASHVKLVWDPPWTMDRMSDEAKLELGLI